MTADHIVRGDLLPILLPLSVVQASGADSPRALIWGLDLRDEKSRHHAKKRLRHLLHDIRPVAESYPRLSHLLVAYTHGGSLPEGSCLYSAAQAATRLHSTLERVRGRSVDVVSLDVTGWEDGELLRDRVLEAVAGARGAAGEVALAWHDIVDTSIHAAALREFY